MNFLSSLNKHEDQAAGGGGDGGGSPRQSRLIDIDGEEEIFSPPRNSLCLSPSG